MKQGNAVLIIDQEIDLCLLMKAFFLRKNDKVYITHSCSEVFSLAIDAHLIYIFLSTAACQNPDTDIVEIRAAFPEAEVIINDLHIPPGV